RLEFCQGRRQFPLVAAALALAGEIEALARRPPRLRVDAVKGQAVHLEGDGPVVEGDDAEVVQQPPVVLGKVAADLDGFTAAVNVGELPADALTRQLPGA